MSAATINPHIVDMDMISPELVVSTSIPDSLTQSRDSEDYSDAMEVSTGCLDLASVHRQASWMHANQTCNEVLFDEAMKPEFDEQAVYVVDVGAVVRKYREFVDLLPRVKPFYAVKCNNDQALVSTLAHMGASFDCASQAEIEQVLATGVASGDIIYANPCKPRSHIRFARRVNVRKMTFDNISELEKIKELFPEAECVLRILTDIKYSLCQLGLKFGASQSQIEPLLLKAKELGLNVIGISFHVGSGCFDKTAFSDAVRDAYYAFQAGAKLGFTFTLLDLGGGFPGTTTAKVTFPEIAGALNESLATYFSESDSAHKDLVIIAEPGRYFAAASHTLAVSIHSVREVRLANNDVSYMYYVNDGAYGSFNCILYDHAVTLPRLFHRQSGTSLSEAGDHRTTVWGPTCDSMDCITNEGSLPKLIIGDWLAFDEMGAYTCAAASSFNGFAPSRKVYINTESASHPSLVPYIHATTKIIVMNTAP